ncbi:acetyl-CoA carboxylase biotin carboxyl carrier protein [Aristophania vespae]|uniref:Biotin carboxyl carrier protein of acetyl-CoA carboxylase n=1 Tax=Aristophania vespae TaxID=2697033 RepID=A0A6P1NCC5_9PROT|nr:acetyl-CoA carboxylase biotin carboxyl carrier protein subunit [Aristophania vespae]QHI95163.1 acetyl-CoA carboxylase biotin carboxyl carrier protein [Aristophania vespae]UMM64383.1 Biotin carboxyl carrier protein of acetyl-CoA carboxylase [Aristophania vespae]
MSRMLVDKEAIRALADILTETGLTEIEVVEADNRIRVARTVTVQAAAPVAQAAPAPQAAAPAVAAPQTEVNPDSHPGCVPSPMVGVAYLTPDPSSPPFVQEGSHVAAGQTIMLIEAMKTFNQIKAPKAGTLTKYCVTSGEPVEFGAPLAIIE